MKLSWQTTLFILFFVNIFVAGMGQLQSMIQASEESERQSGLPVELHSRQYRDAEANAPQLSPTVIASAAKS
jgi:hypothetical protein